MKGSTPAFAHNRDQALVSIPSTIQVVGAAEVTRPISDLLARRGFLPRRVLDAAAMLSLFREEGADLVVLCLPVPGRGGRDLLEMLLSLDPHLKVVVTGSDGELPTAADAYEAGAFEHVADPRRDMASVLSAVGVALGSRRGDRHLAHLRQRELRSADLKRVIGSSASMTEVLHVMRQLCRRTSATASPPTVLLIGETGTGKGLLARSLHYGGARRHRPLVEVNCAALPMHLLESELFGHERGAFADARSTRLGLFETAHAGTLFLDEISAMPLELQPKLLTALEERRIRRIGGRTSIEVDVQVIAAAQPCLRAAIERGTFRADLYHRLNGVAIRVPPLRERGDDKLALAKGFIQELCREYGMPERTLTPQAESAILDYEWPGNVRELRNQIERILLLSSAPEIDASDFDQIALGPPTVEVHSGVSGVRLKLPDAGVPLADLEREALREALARSRGNVSEAARFLRITRQTMISRMRKYGLVRGHALG